MSTFSLYKLRSQLCRRQFHVKSSIESIFSGNFPSFLSNARCYSQSLILLSADGFRHDDAVAETVRTAADDHIDQSDITRDGGGVRRWGGLPAVQEQKHAKNIHSRSSMRESRSRGSKGYQSDPIVSNLSRRSSFEFNAHVTSMYSPSGGKSSDIDAFVKGWLPGSTVREISNFMRITGKKSRNKSHLHLKRHLPAIASRIENLSSDSWRSIDVSAALYGLQCLVEHDDGYLAVVASMTAALVKSNRRGEAVPPQSISMALLGLQKNKLREHQSLELLDRLTILIKSCRESSSSQQVGNALYGMQSMSSDHVEVRSMISALLDKVHSCNEPLSAQAVGNALYGMQSMSSEYSEVRSMISALLDKVHSCKEPLSAQEVGNALYGMQSMSSDHSEARSMISALTSKVYSCKEPLSAQEVGNALYGMQSMSCDHLQIRWIISALTGKVLSCKESLSAQNVGNALYGMQSMSSDHSEVRSMISALTSKVYSCKEPLNAQEVGNALYGMQSMSSDHSEVRSMISALAGKVLSCKESLDAQAVGNALYGMQSMSSNHSEVRSMISALLDKVHSCKEPLSAQAVGNALYGMQSMSSEYSEVRPMISALTGKVLSCNEPLSAQAVGNALYGMQSMSSDHSEVRSMISALLDKVHSCKEPLSAQAVGNALYGMQSMSSEYSEVRPMISALAGKVLSCKELLNAQAVGNALYGMQSMSSDLCVGILTFLLSHTSSLTELNRVSRLDLLSVGQAVLLCIPSRRDVLDDASYESWTKFGDSVCSEHHRRIMNGEYMDCFRSHVEREVHHATVRILGQSRVTVSSNEYLFDMFESDIVVRIPFVRSTDGAAVSAAGKWLVINIEVDGMRHKQEKLINFCKLRDAFLKSRGVVVHRIDASRVNKMDDNQLELWLLDVIAESLLLSA